MASTREPEQPIVVNAPLLRALCWGANIRTDRDLAQRLGIAPSNVSRMLSTDDPQGPSLRTVNTLMRMWPLVPYDRMFRNVGDEEAPEVYGLTQADVAGDGAVDDGAEDVAWKSK